MKKNTINLLSGTILVFSIVLSGACKKVEFDDQKVGGCFDTDSPIHDASIDYDDGTCQYAFVDMYEITKHPYQDPANSGQDWDLIVNTEADIILTVKYPLDSTYNVIATGDTIWGGDILFESSEKTNQTYNTAAKWTSPVNMMMLNEEYAWELYDADVDADDYIASGKFNPIDLASENTIITGDTNGLNEVTQLKLYYTLK
jgi:hypothetical protein